MKRFEPVSCIMTKELVTLTLADDLFQAEKLFKENHIRHIPVVEDDHIIGILSQTDLERISFLDAYDEHEVEVDYTIYTMLSIEHLMVKDPHIISVNTPIEVVAEILTTHEFHALPVVEDDVLVGIVTTTDLLLYLLEQYKECE